MKNVKLFYFSGTGNALCVANWIRENAAIYNRQVDIVSIAAAKQQSAIHVKPTDEIIIISPIHGFNYPPITLQFLKNLSPGTNRVMLMNTRAGMKLWRSITPGITGIAFIIAGWILRQKGYRIAGTMAVDMPSNWISLHPAVSSANSSFIQQRMHQKVNKYLALHWAGKPIPSPIFEQLINLAVAPIALLYYFIGRFLFAKSYYANHHCDQCGACIKACPVGAISLKNGRPFWSLRCESCMHCMNHCPKRAIETGHGLLAITVFIYLAITGVIYRLISFSFPGAVWVQFIISNLIFFLLVLILYQMQHWLLSSSRWAKWIAHTSLTYYRWWGRYRTKPTQRL